MKYIPGIENNLRIEGDRNIIQVRLEKKDRLIDPGLLQSSKPDILPGSQSDMINRISTIYERPNLIPFNTSPVQENIRPLQTVVNTTDRTFQSPQDYRNDAIFVPTTSQDFNTGYQKTPEIDTVLQDTIDLPSPIKQVDDSFNVTDYRSDPIANDRIGMAVVYNSATKRYELYNKSGDFIRIMNFRKQQEKNLYKEITGEDYISNRKRKSPKK